MAAGCSRRPPYPARTQNGRRVSRTRAAKAYWWPRQGASALLYHVTRGLANGGREEERPRASLKPRAGRGGGAGETHFRAAPGRSLLLGRLNAEWRARPLGPVRLRRRWSGSRVSVGPSRPPSPPPPASGRAPSRGESRGERWEGCWGGGAAAFCCVRKGEERPGVRRPFLSPPRRSSTAAAGPTGTASPRLRHPRCKVAGTRGSAGDVSQCYRGRRGPCRRPARQRSGRSLQCLLSRL